MVLNPVTKRVAWSVKIQNAQRSVYGVRGNDELLYVTDAVERKEKRDR